MLSLIFLVIGVANAFDFPSVSKHLYTPKAGKTVTDVAFSLSKTLGDHMVLQSGKPSMVWGFAPSGTTVKTTFAGVQYSTTAGADTIWRQSLPAQTANAVGQTITFSASTGDSASLQDVVFGDVYICSGQVRFLRLGLFATASGLPILGTDTKCVLL